MALLSIGFGNTINIDKLLAIVSPDSAPIKRNIQEAREAGRLIDATYGRRVRAVLYLEGGVLVTSSIQPETLVGRFNENGNLK